MPAYDDVRFVGLSPGQARLLAIGGQPALSRPELYGIAAGRHRAVGRLGRRIRRRGHVSVDGYFGRLPRWGSSPLWKGRISWVTPKRPLGIPIEHVAVPGPLGPLPAWYFPGPVGACLSSRYTGRTAPGGMRRALSTSCTGWVFPLSRSPTATISAPSTTRRVTSGTARQNGATSRRPCAGRLPRAPERRPGRPVHGRRRGRRVPGRSPLAPKVTRVVLDAPMLDLHAAVDHQADRHLLPVIGRLSAPLIWPAKRIASARFGVDWSAAAYLDETTRLKSRTRHSRRRRPPGSGLDQRHPEPAQPVPGPLRSVPGRRPSRVVER